MNLQSTAIFESDVRTTSTDLDYFMAETASLAWWSHSPACYHEPMVHDHSLYFQLSYMNLYLLLPIACIGMMVNAAAMIFLYRPPKITSGVFVYLKVLLILDHCQLFVTATALIVPQICNHHHSKNHTLYDVCMLERRFLKHTMPRILATVNTLHVWTIAALSAHRYWKISRPVISRLKDTVGKAHNMLIAMFAVALIFRLPIFLLELQFKENPIRIQKRVAATEVLTPYRFIYHTILDPLLSNILPFVWMSLFSLLTLYEIFRSRHITYQQIGFDLPRGNGLTQPLTLCLRKKAEFARQKQELRATVSIVLIIILYLLFHTLMLYTVARKWQLLMNHDCPTRADYFHSLVAHILSMISASVNAFVFIAFTSRLKKYVQKLIRKTSRTLSSSSEPPLSPKTTATVEGVHIYSHHSHGSHNHGCNTYSVPL